MAPLTGSAPVSICVTRPRTAPTELATSARARIGTRVVAHAGDVATSDATAPQSSTRAWRGRGFILCGLPSPPCWPASELRERQRLLLVVHHRHDALARL